MCQRWNPGGLFGHEGVGTIEAVGSAISNFRIDDKVLISCITFLLANVTFARIRFYSHCEEGGWLLGNKIDGTQAEYVRIPFADTSLHPIPSGPSEEDIVLFSDILPTGYETGVLKGRIKLGDTVAIIGAGPIGLATLLTAQFYSPAEIIMVDLDDYRLEVAKRFNLKTRTINDRNDGAVKSILDLTAQKGVDVAIEAVGTSEAFDICQAIIAPGGTIANIGVHGKCVCLRLENLWHQNITLTTALVDTFTIPILLKTFLAGKLKPSQLITHHFDLNEILKAYDVFWKCCATTCLKGHFKEQLIKIAELIS